jgi:hypothetical protein
MSESDDKSMPRGRVAVQLDAASIARLDAMLPLYSTPSHQASRSEVLREVILRGLRIEESKREKGPSPGDGSPPRRWGWLTGPER